MNRFHEIEVEKLHETILSTENFRLQSGIFFATVNLGVLSFAVSQQKAALFFFAAVLFWVMIPIDFSARKGLTSYYYRILYLHKKYVRNDKDYSPNRLSKLAQEVQKILNLPNDQDKNLKLISIPWRVRNLFGFWLPISASLVEIVVGVVLWQVLRWHLV